MDLINKVDLQHLCNPKISEALAKAQSEIKAPVKNRHVDFQPTFPDGKPKGQRVKYSYADLADVIEAVRIPLSKNSLAISHQMVLNDKNYDLRTVLMHSSGEWIETFYPLPDPTAIRPQEFGSALTYARRYSLSALVGIASEEDDDGHIAEPPKKPQPKQIHKTPFQTAPQYPQKISTNPQSSPHHNDIATNYLMGPEPEDDSQEQPDEILESLAPMEQILVLRNKLGIDIPAMKEIVQRITGMASTKECSPDQIQSLVNYLKMKLK